MAVSKYETPSLGVTTILVPLDSIENEAEMSWSDFKYVTGIDLEDLINIFVQSANYHVVFKNEQLKPIAIACHYRPDNDMSAIPPVFFIHPSNVSVVADSAPEDSYMEVKVLKSDSSGYIVRFYADKRVTFTLN